MTFPTVWTCARPWVILPRWPRLLATEAKTGVDVVRLVAGDPLSVDAVITEVNALAKAQSNFEIVPGLPAVDRGADLRRSAAGLGAHRGRCAWSRWTGRPWPRRRAR